MVKKLTSKQDWDKCWKKVELPLEIKRSKRGIQSNSILDIFDKFCPKQRDLSILEIGGAPGQYIVYMAKNLHYKVHVLDYSDEGCKKTNENFRLLNIDGKVYQKDLFSDDLSVLPKFDMVYSLGFIEHFYDLDAAIGKHLYLLKPGGLLLVGLPVFQGINYLLMKILAPGRLSMHNLKVMDIKNWIGFEKHFGLKTIFKGYIGGFELKFRFENKTIINQIINFIVRAIRLITIRLTLLRKLNIKYWSVYAIGVYQKTYNDSSPDG